MIHCLKTKYNNVMLLNPKAEESKQCASLLQISGPEFFKYIYNETEENILPLLEYFVCSENNTFSLDKILVDEENGNIRGLILAHPVADLRKFLLNEMKLISRYHEGFLKSFFHILGMFSRFGLVTSYPKLNKDEYFISNLAVFKEYRGKGISKKLLNRVEKDALGKGIKKLSLYVEVNNDVALKVYKRYGFTEEKKAIFKKKYNKFGLYGFSKMVKDISNGYN